MKNSHWALLSALLCAAGKFTTDKPEFMIMFAVFASASAICKAIEDR